MSFFRLLRVETNRLLLCRAGQMALLLAVLSPILQFFVETVWMVSLNNTYIANAALSASFLSAPVFALLTGWEMSRRSRSRVEGITDSICSVFTLHAAQTAALLLLAVLSFLLTAVAWLPFTAMQIGNGFRLPLYVLFYLLAFLFPMVFSILFTAAAYQLTKRFELSLALFAGFLFMSLVVWGEDWLLRWINPSVFYLSDDFGNQRTLMSLAYNRLFWLLLLLGLWTLSMLFLRRYGRGFARSCVRNLKKLYIPALSILLVLSGVLTYSKQPFLDNSEEIIDWDKEYMFDDAEPLAFSSIHVDARPNLHTGCFYGTAHYQVKNKSGAPATAAMTINPGYAVLSVEANGEAVPFRDLHDDDMNAKTIEADLPADRTIQLVVTYGGFPQEWNIMALAQGSLEISKDYLYLTNGDFLPQMENMLYDGRPTITADITLPQGMIPVVFGTGTTEETAQNADGSVSWRIHDSGGTVLLYAGDYVSHPIDAAGIDVEFYYSKKHEAVMKSANVDEMIKQVFNYCTKKYGPLSFYADTGMRLIEIGSAGGGYASYGASVMSEDCFNEQGLNDPLRGNGGAEVLAHEIIHQWWGLGQMFDSERMDDSWSSEGLTVYTTYRLMKELHGQAYAKQFYVDVWQEQVEHYYQNFYVRNPEYYDKLPKQYQAQIENSVRSMRQYCEMPLKILKAEQLVGGEEKMDNILQKLFNREMDYQYPYLTYADFLETCGLTEADLSLTADGDI